MLLQGNRALVAVCASNVVISIVSTLLYYRELDTLRTAPLFATQLNCAMQATLCGVMLVGLDASGLAPRRGQQQVAMRRWVELALWFALQNTLEIASIDGLGPTNGSLAAVLQQMVIPTTLLVSIALLGRSYSRLHWLAATTVTAGVAVSYVPTMVETARSVPWGWAAVLLASRVPQALANVRSEAAIASDASEPPHPLADAADLEPSEPSKPETGAAAGAWPDQLRSVLRAGFWTGLFGLGFNVPSSLALAALHGESPLDALGSDYRTGARCLVDAPSAADGCDGAAAAVLAFALPGALFAVSEFAVVQQASAAAYFLLVALQLPLVAAALSVRELMGSLVSKFRPALLGGVPLIVIGLGLWSAAERRAARRRDVALASARRVLLAAEGGETSGNV